MGKMNIFTQRLFFVKTIAIATAIIFIFSNSLIFAEGALRAVAVEERAKRNPLITAARYTISEWQHIFQNPRASRIDVWLRQNYGDDPTRLSDRVERIQDLLDTAKGEIIFGKGPVLIGRTPCRIRFKGGHTDFEGGGGYLVDAGGDFEMIDCYQSNESTQVILRNMDKKFKGAQFSLDDWDVNPPSGIKTPEEWDGWCAEVEKRKKEELRTSLGSISNEEFDEKWANFREENWQEFVKGLLAFLRTDLGDPTGEIRKKLGGFNALFWSDIPTTGGYSSSSALVMSVAKMLNEIFNLNLLDQEIVNLGLCEHYNGTKGGMADHAAIIFAKRGKVLLKGSFPERVIESVEFPEETSIIMVDSKISRAQAPQVSDKLKKEKIGNPNVILGRTGKAYAFTSLWLRASLAKFISENPNDPRSPRYRKYLQALIPRFEETRDTWGLMREFNQGGKINFSSDVERARTIYEMLKLIPIRVTRAMLRNAVGDLYQDPSQRQDTLNRLEALFKTHPDPDPQGGYNLRGYALYGWAENERCIEYARRAKEGKIEEMLQLMRIAHDGDRVSKEGQPYLEYYEITDEMLDKWSSAPEQNPIWAKPGWFERSIEPVDDICDAIEKSFGDVAAGRIAGAGLGGVVAVLAKSDTVAEVREFLRARKYESTKPLKPAQGAAVISGNFVIPMAISFTESVTAVVSTTDYNGFIRVCESAI